MQPPVRDWKKKKKKKRRGCPRLYRNVRGAPGLEEIRNSLRVQRRMEGKKVRRGRDGNSTSGVIWWTRTPQGGGSIRLKKEDLKKKNEVKDRTTRGNRSVQEEKGELHLALQG